MSITPVSIATTGFTLEEAEALVLDIRCSDDITPLRAAIMTSELVSVVVARLLKGNDHDEFLDHGHTVAQWVREANHGGESIAITDELFIDELMTGLWYSRDEAEAFLNNAKANKK